MANQQTNDKNQWYKTNLLIGKVKEIGTQADEGQDYSFKKEVEKIISHKTEGKRVGVRFLVKWKKYHVTIYERSDVIILKGGSKILKEYLMDLNKKSVRSFDFILKNQPSLAAVLVEDDASEDKGEEPASAA